jgi:alpha-tubulin suppressor-like RCC1 family protein
LGADDAIEETFLYTWGSNKYGQLGLGNYESRSSPTEAQTNLLESNDESLLTVSVKGY